MFVAWQVERVLRDTVSRPLDRRQFLTLSGLAISAQPFHALACRSPTKPGSEPDLDSVGYGPLQPVNDQTTGLPLLYLPNGFQYVSFGWAEDPLSGGLVTPGMHDGMAAFVGSENTVRLVRNHEMRSGRAFASRPAYPVYDVNGGGGTTTLDFDIATGRVVEARVSLTGTAVNCAGGVTPWGSWLTCEETVSGPGGTNGYERPHGYIFEVPVVGTATAEPLAAMGRFVHEATCVDPVTGVVYETEDQDTAGFYRFLPDEFGNLAAGGRLEMLAFSGFPQLDTRTTDAGVWTPVHWVPIDDPDPADATASSVFAQGFGAGGARFARLEGTWFAGARVYVVSTTGGRARVGQVWEYDPGSERIRLVFESPGRDVLDMPDNICASPRGWLVLCEDSPTENFIRGLTLGGEIFAFARNNVILPSSPTLYRNGHKAGRFSGDFSHVEFAGATYSPDGNWLFFNVQVPGITFAVTGPWAGGPL